MARAMIIDGKARAAQLNDTLRVQVAELTAQQRAPCLAVVLVGDDYASSVYVQRKRKACAAVGIDSVDVALPNDVKQRDLAAQIVKLNSAASIDGILVQLPLPPHLVASEIISLISVTKDVDGLHPLNQGLLHRNRALHVACTPLGVIRLLQHTHSSLAGKLAVVIGRSVLVGMPLSRLLLHADATVVNIHSKTPNPAQLASQADILVAAAGVPRLVTADWVKRGATVIDVGINRTDTGLVGDVDYDSVSSLASHITPVPGGVGPMTIAMLLRNTYNAALRKLQA